jgi:hypothetical protein
MEREVLWAAAAVHAAQAQLASVLASFAASDEWEGHGIRSFGHWCDVNLGMSSRAAARLVAAAGRLAELPVIRAAFDEGSLSLEKVQLVAEVASPASDERFASIARAASVAQLGRICAEYRKLDQAESAEAAERRHARRGVTAAPTEDGLVRIVALLEPDEAAIVLAALDARVEQAWREERPAAEAPAPGLSARRADALVEQSTEQLVTGPDPVVRGEKVEVRVLVDAEVLSGERDDGICCIEGIGAVPKATVERLLCDARVSLARRRRDGALDVGRAHRTPTRRQRRALAHRDKGCRYPGCRRQRFVDAHHVRPWEAGGATDMDNMILLCPEHHRLFHEGGYRIDTHGHGRFTFRRADGRTIGPPPLRARPVAASPPAPGDPRAEGRGERYDLALTIDVLVAADA